MTKQEYYDLLVEKAFDETMPCVGDGGCFYWKPEGNACAIGVLLPNGHPGQHFFGPVGDLLSSHKDLWSIVPDGMSLRDLTEVQDVHDACGLNKAHSTESFQRRFVRAINSLACFAGVSQTPWEVLS